MDVASSRARISDERDLLCSSDFSKCSSDFSKFVFCNGVIINKVGALSLYMFFRLFYLAACSDQN